MTTLIPKIAYPELFFGFVAPIGADIRESINSMKSTLEELEYNVVIIKATDIFNELSDYIPASKKLSTTS